MLYSQLTRLSRGNSILLPCDQLVTSPSNVCYEPVWHLERVEIVVSDGDSKSNRGIAWSGYNHQESQRLVYGDGRGVHHPVAPKAERNSDSKSGPSAESSGGNPLPFSRKKLVN
jgi:hypothetical protein